MIAMEDAVAYAFEHFRKLYKPEDARRKLPSHVEAGDPLLEEVELSDDQRVWDVTLGFNLIETIPLTGLQEALARMQETVGGPRDNKRLSRKYKLFRIDAQDGSLVAMKSRDTW